LRCTENMRRETRQQPGQGQRLPQPRRRTR
jgi:hypothetical protein